MTNIANDSLLDLGPFQPPPDYPLEKELHGPPPRRIPEILHHGKYDTARRRAHWSLLISGIVLSALAFLPFVRRLGGYFLPLGYLDWIGVGLSLLGIIAMLLRQLLPGQFKYVRDGRPVIARITALAKVCLLRVNGQDATFGFAAGVELPHPEKNGELMTFMIKSPGFPAAAKDQYETPLRVGQYVTVVYLPGRFEKTLNLYGFLELNPAVNFVVKKNAAPAASLGKTLAVVLAFGLFMGAVLWSVFAISFYEPLNFDYTRALWPALAGGVLIGGALILFLVSQGRNEQSRIAERNREALRTGAAIEISNPSFWHRRNPGAWFLKIILAAGALLLGAIITLSALFTVNAVGDRSTPDMKLVELKGVKMTTYNFLIRTYSFEYLEPGSDKVHSFPTTLAHLQQFSENSKIAFLEIGQGRLGWPWIREIQPGGL